MWNAYISIKKLNKGKQTRKFANLVTLQIKYQVTFFKKPLAPNLEKGPAGLPDDIFQTKESQFG
jgi:hypothetical protein